MRNRLPGDSVPEGRAKIAQRFQRWVLFEEPAARRFSPGGTRENSPALPALGTVGGDRLVPEGRLKWSERCTGMSHTYTSQLCHCVFSTKGRRRIITPELSSRLWPYLGGIAREHKMSALGIGGVENHVHLLLSLPPTLAIAKAIQLIKGGSSKWVHDQFPGHQTFAWQEGYGAFSIGVGNIDRTLAYIAHQAEHHRRTDFKDELVSFLKRHRIEYDERYIWD